MSKPPRYMRIRSLSVLISFACGFFPLLFLWFWVFLVVFLFYLCCVSAKSQLRRTWFLFVLFATLIIWFVACTNARFLFLTLSRTPHSISYFPCPIGHKNRSFSTEMNESLFLAICLFCLENGNIWFFAFRYASASTPLSLLACFECWKKFTNEFLWWLIQFFFLSSSLFCLYYSLLPLLSPFSISPTTASNTSNRNSSS